MTSSKQVCEQLLADALEDGGSDNITIIVGRNVPKEVGEGFDRSESAVLRDGRRVRERRAPAGQSTSGATPASAASAEGAATTRDLTTEDLDAYAKGLARETELVRAAQERARTATTPQARGEAQQAQWEDQTIPEGAKASGLSPERYRVVRNTVNTTFQWLDFQGKIDGRCSSTPRPRRPT